MSNVNNIIKEAIDRDPVSLKETVDKELKSRLREKIEEKKKEYYDDETLEENNIDDDVIYGAAEKLANEAKEDEVKDFAQGLIDYYDENGHFTPAQVRHLTTSLKAHGIELK